MEALINQVSESCWPTLRGWVFRDDPTRSASQTWSSGSSGDISESALARRRGHTFILGVVT